MNKSKNDTYKISSFKILSSYLKPYKFWVFIRILSTCIKALVDVYISILVMKLINSVLVHERQESYKTLFLIIMVIVIDIVAFYFESYSSTIFSAKISYDMKNKFSNHIVGLPIQYIDSQKSGEIVSRLVNNIGAVESYLKGGFLDIIFHFLRFTSCFIIMLFLNWKLLLICIAIMSLATMISNSITKPLTQYNEKLFGTFGKVMSVIQDSVNGIAITKTFNLEKIIKKKYENVSGESLTASLTIDKRNNMILPIKIAINMVPIILCYIIGGYMVIKNIFLVGSLAAFSVMLNYLVEAMMQIPGYISQYRANTGILKDLYNLLNVDSEHFGVELCEENDDKPAFELTDIVFSYNNDTIVLNHLNLEIPSGKKIALVGPSGCGKSTIMKLLCGFYPISHGKIKIFGKDINSLDIESIRSKIMIVTQDTFLFPGTIAENIAYGLEGASMDEIHAAARSAYAHDFIMKLPDQYNSIVGERGVRLSGGEKQRISIARAILKNAPILLMDEPSSSLDTESELMIQKALNEIIKTRTVIIIAHRLSTIKDVDQIIVLNDNIIVESGTHEELLALEGLYSRLYREQSMTNRSDEIEVVKNA